MSTGVDLSQFYNMFFDETEELLSNMEQLLLGLDITHPDIDDLNGIFRAAHSIKGGAGTFGCFDYLANTTHLLENALDLLRTGELTLRKEMIDIFLETKDVLTEQLTAYRDGGTPDQQSYDRICRQLRELALETDGALQDDPVQIAAELKNDSDCHVLRIVLSSIRPQDAKAIEAEMAIMGRILQTEEYGDALTIWVETTASVDDIDLVCGFIVNTDQRDVQISSHPTAAITVTVSDTDSPPDMTAEQHEPASGKKSVDDRTVPSATSTGSSTLRVGVEKVDQIINLVGELVITQAMLVQTVQTMDPVLHDRLVNGVEQLERNARDLQEAVMSIRMMPMDYVFSRFPRVVRENAMAMNKQIRLVTHGQATELDKSLIERIIDPLTHLVRNSIDHGIESPDERIRLGKDAEGVLTLSAQHSGGHIVIQVSDDGAGLNRERILAKAIEQGLPVTENTPDDELWQLIFSPGFSTAEKVTSISGRGVGMDVVRRNIQSMGGHVHLSSVAGKGSVTRIVLPLTLAILDGMSVRVGDETFILPLSHVMESLQPESGQVHYVSDTELMLHVRGEYLPLVSLHDVFDVQNAEMDVTQAIAVILKAEELRFALLVDHLVGQHQVVVKNLESNYRKIPGISAATILGDGSVALIVDVFGLMRLTQSMPV